MGEGQLIIKTTGRAVKRQRAELRAEDIRAGLQWEVWADREANVSGAMCLGWGQVAQWKQEVGHREGLILAVLSLAPLDTERPGLQGSHVGSGRECGAGVRPQVIAVPNSELLLPASFGHQSIYRVWWPVIWENNWPPAGSLAELQNSL